ITSNPGQRRSLHNSADRGEISAEFRQIAGYREGVLAEPRRDEKNCGGTLAGYRGPRRSADRTPAELGGSRRDSGRTPTGLCTADPRGFKKTKNSSRDPVPVDKTHWRYSPGAQKWLKVGQSLARMIKRGPEEEKKKNGTRTGEN